MAATEERSYILNCLWKHDPSSCQKDCVPLSNVPPSIRQLLPSIHLSNTKTIDLVVFELIQIKNQLTQKCQKPELKPMLVLAEKLYALALHFKVVQKDLFYPFMKHPEAISAVKQFNRLPIQGFAQRLEEAIETVPLREGDVLKLSVRLKDLLNTLVSDDPNLTSLMKTNFSKIEKPESSEVTANELWKQSVGLLEEEITTIKKIFRTTIAQFEPNNPLSTQKYRDSVLSKIVAKKQCSLSANEILAEIDKVNTLLQAYKKILQSASSLHSKPQPFICFEQLTSFFHESCFEKSPRDSFFREGHQFISLNDHQKCMRDEFYREYFERLILIKSFFVAAYAKKRSEEKALINGVQLGGLVESVYAFIQRITKEPPEKLNFIIPLTGGSFELQTHLEEVKEIGDLNPDHHYAVDVITNNLLGIKKNLNVTMVKTLSLGLKQLLTSVRTFKAAVNEARRNQSPFFEEIKEQLNQELKKFEEMTDLLYVNLPAITAKIDQILKVGKPKKSKIFSSSSSAAISPSHEGIESLPQPVEELPITDSTAASSEPMRPSEPEEEVADLILSEREIDKTIHTMEQCSTEIESLVQQFAETTSSEFQRNVRLRELMRELHDLGWYLARGHRGKHRCLQHDELVGRIPIPIHGKKIISAGTAKQIRQEALKAKPKVSAGPNKQSTARRKKGKKRP